jgi:response regulator RpfG family c-di-GMP phosphodiesterase
MSDSSNIGPTTSPFGELTDAKERLSGDLAQPDDRQALLAALEALAIAIEARKRMYPSAIPHVRRNATMVARAFGMSDASVRSVEIAAILHDIGTLTVPAHILAKPGPLTPDEFQKIRAHSQGRRRHRRLGAVPKPCRAADSQPP